MQKKNIFSALSSRKFKYGALSTTIIAVVIAIVVLVNLAATLLTDRYSLKLDITGENLYNLADQTIQIINKVENDVTLYVISAKDDFNTTFNEILVRIANQSEHLKIEYIDPDTNPQFLTELGTQYSIQTGAVVMKSGSKVRVINESDMVQTDSQSYTLTYLLEERIAAGLQYLGQSDEQVVYFVEGHSESGADTLKSLFANNGITVESVLTLTEQTKFDPESKMMVIVDPKTDFTTAEIRVLSDFLANDYNYGRHLMVYSPAGANDLPNLEAFLASWGLSFNDNMVLEGPSYYSGYPSTFFVQFESNDLTQSLDVPNGYVWTPSARSIDILFKKQDNITTAPIMVTSDESYAKKLDNVIRTYEKEEGDEDGAFVVGAMAQQAKIYNNVDVYTNVFLCGSSLVMDSSVMESSANGEFFMSMYNFMLNQSADTIFDSAKYSGEQFMTLTETQTAWYGAIVKWIIPGIVLLAGIAVFIRRRYL